jgi:3-dehydroquinate synthetase
VVLPTTLLAMSDSCLGGKTGVDLPQGKNLVGAFHPPRLVLADPAVLSTLPDEEIRSGLAEVVKSGIIGDLLLFEICEQGRQAVNNRITEVVSRSMGVKIHVIQQDPYESGLREVLNLGHTLGHAVEKASGYQLKHGEAVAIGIAAETKLSTWLGMADTGLLERVERVLVGLGLPIVIPGSLSHREIQQHMKVDKKRISGKTRFALPVKIGEVTPGVIVEEEMIWQLILSCMDQT